MITAKNLIFEGEYFYPIREPSEGFITLKKGLTEYLYSQQFALVNSNLNPFTITNFFSLKFIPMGVGSIGDIPIKYRILEKFGRRHTVEQYKYDQWIKYQRVENPFIVQINVRLQEKGFNLKVIVKSLCYQKLAQSYIKSSQIDQDKYNFIEAEICNFIEEIMSAIHAKELKPPKAQSILNRFRLSPKLDSLGFKSLAELLDRGYSKIQNGKIEDGLMDLRSTFEEFLVECVKLIGEKPESQQKVKDNLCILKNKGYLDDKMFELLKGVLYSFLYSYLSEIPSHKREKSGLLNEFDANYSFLLFEDTMDLLLNKILKRV
jgi:hypothetical protein